MSNNTAVSEESWRRYLLTMGRMLAGTLAVAVLAVALANPYGNLPPLLFARHVITDSNQRYQFPAVVRSGEFDSMVVGTSTARLLRPGALEGLFGGRFANLSLDGGRAWEQYRLASFFQQHVAHPRTLLVGLDNAWCANNADTDRITERGFPEWMYDDDPWNDLPYMLNRRTVEIAGRRFATALGLGRVRIAFDGYQVFTPPEETYNLALVKEHIYGRERAKLLVAAYGTAPPTAVERGAWRFPALAWLEDLIAPGKWERVVLVFTPPHFSTLPAAGSTLAKMENECKSRVTRIAEAAGATVIDFRFASPLTRETQNFWDAVHYRVPVGERLVMDIGRAVAEGGDDGAGVWRTLTRPSHAADIPTSSLQPH